MDEKTLDRFWSHVQKSAGCWEWTSTLREGYGMFSYKGKPISAHRFSWKLANGQSIPKGELVRHRCDNPPCVRPDHLILGGYPETHSLLTNNEVIKAREMAANGMNAYDILSQLEFNGPVHLLSSAIRGKTFKHLPGACDVEVSRQRKPTKLSHQDVADILKALESPYRGIVNDLASKYGVKHNTISAIKHGRRPANYGAYHVAN